MKQHPMELVIILNQIFKCYVGEIFNSPFFAYSAVISKERALNNMGEKKNDNKQNTIIVWG